MQTAFSEPAKNNMDGEKRFGIASSDDGTNTYMRILLTWLLILFPLTSALQAAPIPQNVKKTVVFIFALDSPTNVLPDGTGFLVSVTNANDTNRFFGYLVTAKHVLRPTTNFWLPGVIVRLNLRDGTSQTIPIPLITTGQNKNVFIHDDPTVDIALVPFVPQSPLFDTVYLPADFIPTESDFKAFTIREGSDVFFSGMFTQVLGDKHNTPITRFGKVALMPDQTIDWVFGKTDLYLIEANSYPGNSGSPVMFQIGMERESGFAFGGPKMKLAGVMSGCYNDMQPVKTLSVSTNQYVTPNLGIAGVVPSYKLKDILFSKELQHQRGQ